MTYKLRRLNGQSGFTIVELLVATAVLSVILMIVTVVMVGIGNLYYRGINQARIQSNVRSLTDEISQKLQLSDGSSFTVKNPDPSVPGYHIAHALCIGTTRYNYVLNEQIGSADPVSGSPVKHVLWRDTIAVDGCSVLDNFWKEDIPQVGGADDDGSELIAPHSRLSSFDVAQASSNQPYHVSIGVAFGDGDLLCNHLVPGDCDANTDEIESGGVHHTALNTAHRPYDIICRSRKGDQFCATSALQTTVVQRLINQDT
jgi:prepilin-type N-terminal cleavage/methylation domain-containing protein